MHHAATVEADQLPLLDVPSDIQPLPLVCGGVHVLHACATNLLLKKTQIHIYRFPNEDQIEFSRTKTSSVKT